MNVYLVSIMKNGYLINRVVVSKDAMTAANMVLAAFPGSELLELSKKHEVDLVQE